ILFMIIIIPIFLGIVGLGGFGTKFSLYNESWDGLSTLRVALENEGYTGITNGMSSLSVLNRQNTTGVLAIVGPASKYSMIDTISLVTFLARGGSLLVADDYGTGAEIFEPLFNILNTWDEVSQLANLPSLSDLFGFGGENETSSLSPETLLFDMLFMLRGFAFNGSVLMDAESYTTNPAQPLLVNYESSNPLTAGISKGIQMEFGTVLSIAIHHSEYIDSGVSETVKVYQTDWMPLQAVSLELFGFEIQDQFLPFLPFYSTKSSWMESDFQAAKRGTSTPDIDEWGNVMFAPMMSIPIGLGKIVMIGDPDIFINKWIDKPEDNDNLIFSLNLFDYLTADLNGTGGNPRTAPIIFDEGHSHQKFYSASVYSIILMKLITEMSMFPLYSPFIPFFLAIIAYPLIPKKTRLTPILWTKYRGEAGRSRFEREIKRIMETGGYSEAIGLLYRAMLRGLRKVSKQSMETPEEIAEFFLAKDPSLRAKDLLTELTRIHAYLERPRILPEHLFMRYMTFIKGLIDRI
ncbi:MAG: DUF4350 domain-containing protein, partial [Candidatus Heimdallarchaeota archaeon]